MNMNFVVKKFSGFLEAGFAWLRNIAYRNWKDWKLNVRKVCIELMNLVFDHDSVFGMIGLVNRKAHFVESVFLVYPETPEYTRAYVFEKRARQVTWTPWLCGLIIQNGRLIVQFLITASGEETRRLGNKERLKGVADRMEEIRSLLGANRKTFAGTLPGILFRARIIRETPEADLTAIVVCQAAQQILKEELLGDFPPTFVLGGRGFVGRRVVRRLREEGMNVCSIDTHNLEEGKMSLNAAQEQRVLVVNVATSGVLRDYVNILRSAVVLNEVYPEPSREILRQISDNNCSCHHVVGVRAFALPSFPGAYKGAVPCCGSYSSRNMRVVTRKL